MLSKVGEARYYAVSTDSPDATVPNVLVDVNLSDEHKHLYGAANVRRALWGDDAPFHLWIPSLETWTLDTVRMLFTELSAYLPPDPAATAGVDLEWAKRTGRAAASPKPPRLREAVFWVAARGWRAGILTSRNERTRTDERGLTVWGAYPTGEWTAPMMDTLMALAASLPLSLQAIGRVLPGDPSRLNLKYPPRVLQVTGNGRRRPAATREA
jgi:hypothetical protein